MKIYIASDHAGYELKEKLKMYLSHMGRDVEDRGAYEYDPNDDYPDYVKQVAVAIAQDQTSRGIIIGGSGEGEAMCANRIAGVRAAVFYGTEFAKTAVDVSGRTSEDPFEIVRLTRLHNDANVLSLSSRFLNTEEATEAVKIFLETKFSGEAHHTRRLSKF